jgi:antitoxin component YwqK of YwqJK toxin-antitoxin module
MTAAFDRVAPHPMGMLNRESILSGDSMDSVGEGLTQYTKETDLGEGRRRIDTFYDPERTRIQSRTEGYLGRGNPLGIWSITEYYENGKKKAFLSMKGLLRHGRGMRWYEDGTRKWQAEYVDN